MSEQFKSIETTELTRIANAIRVKTGTTDKISLEDMPAKIAAIESAGGDSIETCTVTITTPKWITLVGATTFANGAIDAHYESYSPNANIKTITVQSVVCGSVLAFDNTGYYMPGYTFSDAELLDYAVNSDVATALFKITAPSGGVATIDVFNNN